MQQRWQGMVWVLLGQQGGQQHCLNGLLVHTFTRGCHK